MPYGIPNFAAALRETVARQRRPRREVDSSEYELPGTPSFDEYRQHQEGLPDYEDYKPGFGGQVAAGLVGLAEGLNSGAGAGVRAGREVMDRGYVRALREHGQRGDILREKAGYESERNKGRLDLLKERRLAERSEDELALQEEAADIADRAEQRLGWALTVNDENEDANREAANRRNTEDVAARRYSSDAGVRSAGIHAEASRYATDKRLEGDQLGFGRKGRGADKVIPVGQQGDADRQAIEQVVRLNPKFMKFVDEIAGKDDSDFKGYRIVPGDKVPQEDTWMPFEGDERDMTPEERQDYAAFIQAVEDTKKQMYETMVDPYERRGFGSGAR